MATVPVGEKVNPDHPVVQACGLFVKGKGVELAPALHIVQQIAQADTNLQRIDTDGLLCLAKGSGPSPSAIEHFPVQPANIDFAQYILIHAFFRPCLRDKNIRLLVLVQLAL